MKWHKHGVIWVPDGSLPWARGYASCPTPVFLSNGLLRVYVQCRDANNVGRIAYVDLDPENLMRVVDVSTTPVLDVGAPGAFDDSGVFQTSVVALPDGRLRMYYVGFELLQRIRYRLLTGVAESDNGGKKFTKLRATPILERSDAEMAFRCGTFVTRDEAKYRMWYVAGSDWEIIDGKDMPIYDIRYLESADGLIWPDRGRIVVPIDFKREHGFGRPYVIRQDDGQYEMYYSIRRREPRAYGLGFAVSADGINWTRQDETLNLVSSPEGWDSESMEYSAPITINGRTYCLYNGNDFGVTGFGLAERVG